MTIKEIIERLEMATGPDGELDQAIAKLIWGELPAGSAYPFAEKYTASLDAALTLVPAGAEYEISTLYGIAHVAMPLNADDCQTASRQDGKVALALCTAALKARLVSTDL